MSSSLVPARLVEFSANSGVAVSTLGVSVNSHAPNGVIQFYVVVGGSFTISSVTIGTQDVTASPTYTDANSPTIYAYTATGLPLGATTCTVNFSGVAPEVYIVAASYINGDISFTRKYSEATASVTTTISANDTITSVNCASFGVCAWRESSSITPTSTLTLTSAATVAPLASTIRVGNLLCAVPFLFQRTDTTAASVTATFNQTISDVNLIIGPTVWPQPQAILTPTIAQSVVIDGAGKDWANATNALALDGNFATVGAATSTWHSNRLELTGMNANIPSSATIQGILVEAYSKANTSGGNLRFGTVLASAFCLSPVTQTQSATLTDWLNMSNSIQAPDLSTFGMSYAPSDINSTSFGVGIQSSNAFLISKTFSVDYARIAVYYTIGQTTGNLGFGVSGGVSSGKILAST